jgi:hypothetical protein
MDRADSIILWLGQQGCNCKYKPSQEDENVLGPTCHDKNCPIALAYRLETKEDIKGNSDFVKVVLTEAMCTWTEELEGNFVTSCGHSFIFTSGGIREDSSIRFCLYCGKEIETQLEERTI